MGQDRDTEILIDSFEEFRALVMEAFRRKLRVATREAEEAGWAILGEFSVGAEHLAAPLLRIRFICEPGKAARVLAVDGPEDCAALFPENDWPSTSIH